MENVTDTIRDEANGVQVTFENEDNQNQESIRIPNLRKRKTAQKSTSKTWCHVTEDEMKMTSLPSSLCRAINFKARQSTKEETKHRNGKKNKIVCQANDGFYVKTGKTDLYKGELNFSKLYKQPTSLCPSPSTHVIKVFDMRHELPVACPTCWSVQRNS